MDYYKDIFSKRPYLEDFDFSRIKSSAYVIDLDALERNLKILDTVQKKKRGKNSSR